MGAISLHSVQRSCNHIRRCVRYTYLLAHSAVGKEKDLVFHTTCGWWHKYVKSEPNPGHRSHNLAVEVIGYVGRILSHRDVWSLSSYIMQSLLILIAPALFAASIYIILGRIIIMVDGERYSLIRQKWLTKIFVCGDVLSFLLQGAGELQVFPLQPT